MEKNEEKTNNNNISLLNLKHMESEVNVGIDIGGSLSKLSVVVNKKNGEAINYLRKLTNFEEINLNSDLIFLSLFHTPQETSVQNEKASIFPVLKQLQQKFQKVQKIFTGFFSDPLQTPYIRRNPAYFASHIPFYNLFFFQETNKG